MECFCKEMMVIESVLCQRRRDMSLKIYHCSRIEDLAEKLAGELTADRAAKGQFEFLKVAVANLRN